MLNNIVNDNQAREIDKLLSSSASWVCCLVTNTIVKLVRRKMYIFSFTSVINLPIGLKAVVSTLHLQTVGKLKLLLSDVWYSSV